MKILCLYDIDDCIMQTESQVFYTRGKKLHSLSTLEYARRRKELIFDKKNKFDWTEFRDGDVIEEDMANGIPNQRMMDLIKSNMLMNIDVGFLTARGNQPAVYRGLQRFFVHHIPLFKVSEHLVFAMNDTDHLKRFFQDESSNSALRKYEIVDKILVKEFGYSKIVYFDNDVENVEALGKHPVVQTNLVLPRFSR